MINSKINVPGKQIKLLVLLYTSIKVQETKGELVGANICSFCKFCNYLFIIDILGYLGNTLWLSN